MSEDAWYNEQVERARAMFHEIERRLRELKSGQITIDCPTLMVLRVDKVHWPPGYSLVEYLITGQSLGRMWLGTN